MKQLQAVEVYEEYLINAQRGMRSGQMAMIEAISDYLARPVNETKAQGCFVEAGTGTGKTVGYSLPAIAHALKHEHQVIISTATIALQNQLIHDDLPEIQKYSGLTFSFGLLKGRRNYACHLKLSERAGEARGAELMHQLNSNAWDGDRESVRLDNTYWESISCESHQCKGRKCPFFSECVYNKVREEVKACQVIVTNHALLMTDISIGGDCLLPAVDNCVVVLDEAHKVPDIARDQFAMNCPLHVRAKSVRELAIEASQSAVLCAQSKHYKGFQEKLTRYDEMLEELNMAMSSITEQVVFSSGAASENVKNVAHAISAVCSGLKHNVQSIVDELSKKDGYELPDVLENKLLELNKTLVTDDFIWRVYGRHDEGVPLARWIKPANGGVSFHLSPISAQRALQQNLWAHAYKVICSSATLRVAGSFEAFSNEIGAEGDTCCAESPFDYPTQCALHVGPIRYPPTDPRFYPAVHDYIQASVAQSGHKGTLVLFTSIKKMQEAKEALPQTLQAIILMQGEMSKRELIECHKSAIDEGQHSVIFGVDGMSEGVDLKGDYLSQVIIVKLSFLQADDPVSTTLEKYLSSIGKNAFLEVQVPKTARKLVQACGRLIRSESDSGEIHILDNRLHSKRYGATMLNSLPMKAYYPLEKSA